MRIGALLDKGLSTDAQLASKHPVIGIYPVGLRDSVLHSPQCHVQGPDAMAYPTDSVEVPRVSTEPAVQLYCSKLTTTYFDIRLQTRSSVNVSMSLFSVNMATTGRTLV